MHDPRPDQINSIILYGWSKSREDNIPVNEVYTVQNGVIVGGGISSPIVRKPWMMNVAKSESVIANFAIRTLPELSWAFNLPKGGWVAVAKAKHASVQNLEFYGRLSNGSLCKIEFN